MNIQNVDGGLFTRDFLAEGIQATEAWKALDEVTVGPSRVFFTSWVGFDEMDEVAGDGPPNCTKTAPSRSPSPITTATRPFLKTRGFFNSLLGPPPADRQFSTPRQVEAVSLDGGEEHLGRIAENRIVVQLNCDSIHLVEPRQIIP